MGGRLLLVTDPALIEELPSGVAQLGEDGPQRVQRRQHRGIG